MSTADAVPYRDNLDLLQALRQLGDSMIERALLQRQMMESLGAIASGAAASSAIAPEPADRLAELYRQASRQRRPDAQLLGAMERLDATLQRQWEHLAARSAASVDAQVFLPWVHLTLLFQLDRQDQTLLLCALLLELDARYGAILEALADVPPAPPAATGEHVVPLASAASLSGSDTATRLDVQERLMSDAPLRNWDLVELAAGSRLGTLAGSYRLSPSIAAYLLARAAPQLRLDEPLEAIDGTLELDEHLVHDTIKQQLGHFLARAAVHDAQPTSYVLHLQGPDPVMQESLCAAAFRQAGMRAMRLDGRALWQAYVNGGRNRAALTARLRMLCRDALLSNRVLVLMHCQWLSSQLSSQDSADDLLDDVCHTLLDSQRYVAVLNGPARRIADLAHRYREHRAIPVLIKSTAPDTRLRRRIWQRHLDAFASSGFAVDDETVDQLVNLYPFTEDQIVTAVKDAASRALVNPDAGRAQELLFEACREESRREQLSVAQEVKTAYRFDDLVLPEDTRRTLAEVLHYARNRHQVVETWGFDSKHHNSRNLCVLFHGPSGTGKTMTASIIANELNLSLYRIDLASVVSKYIGETEKQLAQLFDQAEAMNVVLFFDEAESLFSKRTETKDAHDRYANLQTGYLLQRIETYPGIVILSTNLLQNMDKAFMRRFKFMIEYPFPNREQRLRLWRNAFPAATPLAGDIDFDLFAEKAPLAGGNINNIAIGAAFLAAADGLPVAHRHVLQATEREYHKLGKVFSAGDFNWGEEE
ncbi:ATP-binding protein [Trinickia sp. YCB016]